MNRKYLNIPEKFQGKIIFITGSLPGVGKSFIKNLWADKLEKAGFRVFNKGTTWKASTNGTMASQSLKYTNQKFVSNGDHLKTNGFYFIDEAFMISQEKMDEVIKAYPRCMFIMFGDPLQFDPADGGTCLYRADLIIDLTKQMRAEDETLLHAIQNIKDGVMPVNFMLEHAYNEDELQTKNKSLVISYKKCYYENNKSNLLLEVGEIVRSQKRGKYIDQYGNERYVTNETYRNGDLWKIESTSKCGIETICSLRRLSDDFKINVSETNMHIFFTNAHFINAHKCQGDTIKNQDICINIDAFLEDNINSLQKHLYVAISRAQYSKQIIFNKSQVLRIKDLVLNKMDYKFDKSIPMVSSCSESLAVMTVEQIINTFDYIGIPYLRASIEADLTKNNDWDKSTTFRPLLYIYLNLDKSTDNNQNKDPLFGLDLNQNSEGSRLNALTEVPFADKKEKSVFVYNLDKDLNNRPLQSIPDKGKCFISKNKMLLNAAKHDDKSLEELHWFVFELDEVPLKEQYALLDRKNKKNINKYLYRVIYSGDKSLHYWIYIKNAPKDVETYKKTARALNNILFDGKACQSCISPSGLMRAPNVIRPSTNNEQKLIKRTRKVCCFDYSIFDNVEPAEVEQQIENIEPTKYDNKVIYAFNMMKNDHDKSNGGRGRLILAKAHNEIERGWTKEEAWQLIEMLCLEWRCPEKIERLKKNIC